MTSIAVIILLAPMLSRGAPDAPRTGMEAADRMAVAAIRLFFALHVAGMVASQACDARGRRFLRLSAFDRDADLRSQGRGSLAY